MEFQDWTFENVLKWMNNWINTNRSEMECIHKLEEVIQ